MNDALAPAALTRDQLSDEPFNDIRAAFGIATIALARRHFCFGLAASICRKGSAHVNLFLELPRFITSNVTSISLAGLYGGSFTRLS